MDKGTSLDVRDVASFDGAVIPGVDDAERPIAATTEGAQNPPAPKASIGGEDAEDSANWFSPCCCITLVFVFSFGVNRGPDGPSFLHV